MRDDFHGYKRKLERHKEFIRKSQLSEQNKKDMLGFSDECLSLGLSIPRTAKYLRHLRQLACPLGVDFSDAKKEDIKRVAAWIEQSGYSDWTKHDLRVTLKKFYRYLRHTEDDPPEVAWLKCWMGNHNRKLPEEILSEEEVSRMVDACHTARDKALVAVMYESGCRIGELSSLKLKHVVRHPHGYRLHVSGKTGDRTVLVVSSAPYLTNWLNDHPRKLDPDTYLWVRGDGKHRLGYSRFSSIIRSAALRADVRKNVNPHAFRHSRATHLANHLTEAQMNEFFGWVQGSNMPSVYVHLSGRDVDRAILKTHGIEDEEKDSSTSRFASRVCPRCELRNGPTNRFCSRCGTPLDEREASEMIKRDLDRREADAVMDALLKDPEFRDVLRSKLRAMTKRKQ